MSGKPLLAACARASFSRWLALLLLAAPFTASQAALTLSSTRLVFDSSKSSTSIVIRNPGKQTYAVQAWINTVEDTSITPVPFVISPQLFRLGPGNEQHIQINGLPNDLPDDRESLFFFNAQEIPQADNDNSNVLNIALRTRIKLFYRPQQIKGSLTAQLKALQFSLHDNNGQPELRVHNPTPFHMTFIRLEVIGKAQRHALKATDMLSPMSTQSYPLASLKTATDLEARFSVINDFGGYTEPVTLPVRLTR